MLIDLDGTLVDSVYQHVPTWKDALDEEGIPLSVWRVHRRIDVSGGLLINQLLRETGLKTGDERLERLCRLRAEADQRHVSAVRLLPGARGSRDTHSEACWAETPRIGLLRGAPRHQAGYGRWRECLGPL